MRLALIMTPRRTIAPATPEDAELLRHIKPGDLLPVTIRKARNGDHHRKFMALCAFVAEHHPGKPDQNTGEIIPWVSTDSVLNFLKFATGHYDAVAYHGGYVVASLKSISYDAMDEAEFAVWSKQAKEVVFSQLFPGLRNRKRIEREIEEWTAWT